jgi:hypothetical protein
LTKTNAAMIHFINHPPPALEVSDDDDFAIAAGPAKS